MKIQLLSDLHIEFRDYTVDNTANVDVLVLAGDIGVISKPKAYFKFIQHCAAQFPQIILITGNHEYYWHSIKSADQAIVDFIARNTLNNVHFLNRDVLLLQDVLFYGATLWSDYCNPQAAINMADFRVISLDGIRQFTYQDAQYLHSQTIVDIQNLRARYPDNNKIAIITHHAPSYQSVTTQFFDNFMNSAFVSDLEWLIKDVDPNIWCHGHVHSQHNYKVHNTSVICNARGYPQEDVGPFKDIAIIEI